VRIIVTGGAGFIGSHLCKYLLERGHEVICLDNMFTSHRENIAHLVGHERFEFLRHDVCDPWHIECDQIYHLACPASPVHYQRNPVRTIETAMMGTRNALQCARNTRARLLITSTSEVYGDPEVHPQKEDYWGHVNPIGYRACYDEGKRVGESLAVAWADQYNTDVRIARLFNTYGTSMTIGDGRLIPNFILQAIRGEDLTVYGDGSQTRSFCYVSDTVEALHRLMQIPTHKDSPSHYIGVPHQVIPVVNVGNPDERSIKSVAEDVISHFDGKSHIRYMALPADDPKQRCPDIGLARKLLKWEPKVSYKDGIAKTIAWYLERGTR
jgi:UDP-glucuronate decarboxylase